ncbi:hypothetical protein [Marmoricola sp. URHB0036]|uniref:hypothetical protein n=1 Tax=Marmoricola sp. URHB0036 TaxID=1298863 RepID=UPI0012DE0987|nr:hypothetical protein [Marmoricola sp. URHB0036]
MDRLLYLTAILMALLITFALGLWAFETAQDVATATAPVITALATIGAAVFGISVGREAGKSEGREQGTKTGRKEVAAEVLTHLHATATDDSTSLRAASGVGGQPGSPSTSPSILESRLRQILDS